jgi:hypothetical protein
MRTTPTKEQLAVLARMLPDLRRAQYSAAIKQVAEEISQRPWCPTCRSTGWVEMGVVEAPAAQAGSKVHAACQCENGNRRVAEFDKKNNGD